MDTEAAKGESVCEMEPDPSYLAGRRAFRDGQGDDVCPYPPSLGTSNNRRRWMDGYYGARVDAVLKRISDASGKRVKGTGEK